MGAAEKRITINEDEYENNKINRMKTAPNQLLYLY
jgi:hypothetical protein